ncbi:MAG: YdcF family protein [Lachnospiraceae bacterium]|nr:YdcF family protein [Lachnospiraceae bacterium]
MTVWLVLAALCIWYGMYVKMAGSGTTFFMVWFGLGVIFGAFSVATFFDVWNKIPVLGKRGIFVFLCIGLIVFVTTEGLIISKFDDTGKEDLDYIIVLGAQVYTNKPSPVLRYRLDSAIEYLNNNPDTRCIVSGAKGYNEPYTEAEGMAKYLIENGIEEERIIQEKKATTTEENIKYSMELMEEGATVGVVTNNFHLFRALEISKKQGLKDVSGIASESRKDYLPNNMLREFMAMVKFWIR